MSEAAELTRLLYSFAIKKELYSREHLLVGSLAGAVHLLNDNAGVLRGAQEERKSSVEQKGKSSLDFDFQYEYKL